jgi:hypothetical protein
MHDRRFSNESAFPQIEFLGVAEITNGLLARQKHVPNPPKFARRHWAINKQGPPVAAPPSGFEFSAYRARTTPSQSNGLLFAPGLSRIELKVDSTKSRVAVFR